MTDSSRCPHCGASRLVPAPRGVNGAAGRAGQHPLDSLYREVRRIREIAEGRTGPGVPPDSGARPATEPAAADSERRIAELTREVLELRATVARLRGSSAVGLAHSA